MGRLQHRGRSSRRRSLRALQSAFPNRASKQRRRRWRRRSLPPPRWRRWSSTFRRRRRRRSTQRCPRRRTGRVLGETSFSPLSYFSKQRCQRDGGGGSATHDTVVDHGDGLADRGVIVGELQIAAEAGVQRRALMREPVHAVDPRIEVAIAAGGPFDVVDEVVPDVFHDRAYGGTVEAGIVGTVGDGRAAETLEHESGGQRDDLEIGLSGRARVVKVHHHAPVPGRAGWRDHVIVGEQDRVRPPLLAALVAVGCRLRCREIVALGRAAVVHVAVARFGVQPHGREPVATDERKRCAAREPGLLEKPAVTRCTQKSAVEKNRRKTWWGCRCGRRRWSRRRYGSRPRCRSRRRRRCWTRRRRWSRRWCWSN